MKHTHRKVKKRLHSDPRKYDVPARFINVPNVELIDNYFVYVDYGYYVSKNRFERNAWVDIDNI